MYDEVASQACSFGRPALDWKNNPCDILAATRGVIIRVSNLYHGHISQSCQFTFPPPHAANTPQVPMFNSSSSFRRGVVYFGGEEEDLKTPAQQFHIHSGPRGLLGKLSILMGNALILFAAMTQEQTLDSMLTRDQIAPILD